MITEPPAVAAPTVPSAGQYADAAGLPPTPFLEVETAVVGRRLRELSAALPDVAIHYPVKANPHRDVLSAVIAAGGNFDVASATEVRAAFAAGGSPDDLVCSNPHETPRPHRRGGRLWDANLRRGLAGAGAQGR